MATIIVSLEITDTNGNRVGVYRKCRFEILGQGQLMIVGEGGEPVAAFAHGTWLSVTTAGAGAT